MDELRDTIQLVTQEKRQAEQRLNESDQEVAVAFQKMEEQQQAFEVSRTQMDAELARVTSELEELQQQQQQHNQEMQELQQRNQELQQQLQQQNQEIQQQQQQQQRHQLPPAPEGQNAFRRRECTACRDNDIDLVCCARACRGLCVSCFMRALEGSSISVRLHQGLTMFQCPMGCRDGVIHPGTVAGALDEAGFATLQQAYHDLVEQAGNPEECRRRLDSIIAAALVRNSPCCNRPFHFDIAQCACIACQCQVPAEIDGVQRLVQQQFCFFCLDCIPPPTTEHEEDPGHAHVRNCRKNPNRRARSLYFTGEDQYNEFITHINRRTIRRIMENSRSSLALSPADHDTLTLQMLDTYGSTLPQVVIID